MFFTLLTLIHTRWRHAIPFVNFQWQCCNSMFQILRSSAVKAREFCNNYLKSICQPNNAINNIQFMVSMKLLHVSAAGCHSQSWNCILLSEFVLWYIDCEDTHGVNNVKYLKYLYIFFHFQNFKLWYLKCWNHFASKTLLVLKYKGWIQSSGNTAVTWRMCVGLHYCRLYLIAEVQLK